MRKQIKISDYAKEFSCLFSPAFCRRGADNYKKNSRSNDGIDHQSAPMFTVLRFALQNLNIQKLLVMFLSYWKSQCIEQLAIDFERTANRFLAPLTGFTMLGRFLAWRCPGCLLNVISRISNRNKKLFCILCRRKSWDIEAQRRWIIKFFHVEQLKANIIESLKITSFI